MRNPSRSDAKKRRQTLLDAAAEIFAQHGYGAPLDSIAARAGVGQGTLYRNFSSREDLLAALIDRDLTDLEEAVAGTEAVEHPFAMMEFLAETSVVNPLLSDYWTALPPDSPLLLAGQQRYFALANRGLLEAKQAGRLREDFGVEDFCLIAIMFRAIRFGANEAERRQNKHRVLTLLSEGFAL